LPPTKGSLTVVLLEANDLTDFVTKVLSLEQCNLSAKHPKQSGLFQIRVTLFVGGLR